MESPFIYNKYVTGKNFVGRKGDVTILSNLIAQHENIVLYAPPKSGKMSAVQQAIYEMRLGHKDIFVAEVSFVDIRDLGALVRRLGDGILRAVASTGEEYAELVRTCLHGTHFVFDE